MPADITITVMTESDAAFAAGLTDIEKWYDLPDDFRRLVSLEPDGCFIAQKGGERVGMITTTTYGDCAFMGNLIVRREYRGAKIGETLMRHAIDYLQQRGMRTIELDGVFPAVAMYRRLGFRDKCLSLRFLRGPDGSGGAKAPAAQVSWDDVIGLDNKLVGLERQRIVRRFLTEFGQSLYTEAKGELSAYALVRPRAEGRLTIAPLVSTDDAGAESLLTRIVADCGGRTLTAGVLETNRAMVRLLLSRGFVYGQPSLRMYMGERRTYEKYVYTILSADKG